MLFGLWHVQAKKTQEVQLEVPQKKEKSEFQKRGYKFFCDETSYFMNQNLVETSFNNQEGVGPLSNYEGSEQKLLDSSQNS